MWAQTHAPFEVQYPHAAVLQLSRSTLFFFYIFTLSDKAPVAFSIMLCRCSQQERVIALGVWSSLRRLEAQGRAVRRSRRTRQFVCAFQMCVLLSHRKNNVMFSFWQGHVACAATLHMRATCLHMHERGNDMHVLTTWECLRSLRFLALPFDNCIEPTHWLADGDSRVPRTCQLHHMRPQAPGTFSVHGK